MYEQYVRPLRLPVDAAELGPQEVVFVNRAETRSAGYQVAAWVEDVSNKILKKRKEGDRD